MHCALLPDGTRKPARALRPAVALLLTAWLALSSIAARAEPRQDERDVETPPREELNLPLIVRTKKVKCKEYAELTGINQFFCTRYMNERLVEILLTSARTAETAAETPAEPRRDEGR